MHDTLERSQYNFSEAEKSPPPTLPTIVGLFLPGENGEARIKHGCDVINDEIEVGTGWCYPSVSPTTFCSISFDGTRPIMIVDE